MSRQDKLEYLKKYYIKNKKKIILQNRKYAKEHKIEVQIRQHNWYLKNKERILLLRKEYMLIPEHKERHNEICRLWTSIPKNRARMSNYICNRLQNDTNFRLMYNLRTRVRQAIKHNYKSASTIVLIGCSIEFLKQYLKNKFKPGMTWNNWSKTGWHIDHIKPCVLFDLSNPVEQSKCFHYTNLQPLWAKENLSKGKVYNE